VTIPPPSQSIDSSQLLQVTATVVNTLQPRPKLDLSTSESFNGFGYWIRVDCESLNPTLHSSSLAVVQDQLLVDPAGPQSFTLTYTMDPVKGNRLTIPVFAWLVVVVGGQPSFQSGPGNVAQTDQGRNLAQTDQRR